MSTIRSMIKPLRESKAVVSILSAIFSPKVTISLGKTAEYDTLLCVVVSSFRLSPLLVGLAEVSEALPCFLFFTSAVFGSVILPNPLARTHGLSPLLSSSLYGKHATAHALLAPHVFFWLVWQPKPPMEVRAGSLELVVTAGVVSMPVSLSLV